jgi:hypothetical protein
MSQEPEIVLGVLTYVTRPGLLQDYDTDHSMYGNELFSLIPHLNL